MNDTNDVKNQLDSIKTQIANHQRRLNKLKEKLAKLGTSADPAIETEIEDIEKKIEALEKERVTLEVSSNREGEPESKPAAATPPPPVYRLPHANRPNPSLIAEETAISNRLPFSPFEHPYAEDDLNFLFGSESGGFWSDHPCYSRLAGSNSPEVVYGAEGCGKTAFAVALVEGINREGVQRQTLPLYIAGQPEINEIQQEIARKLLAFIGDSPLKLAQSGSQEQNLLARQLCISLGYEVVRAALQGAARRQLGQPEDSRHLNALEQRVAQYASESWKGTGDWLELTRRSLAALDIDCALISLDLDTNDANYAREILNLLRPWEGCRLAIKLFMPQTIAKAVRHSGRVEFRPLNWTDEQLGQMAEWRFETAARLSDAKLTIDRLFDPGLYSQFIQQAKCNPRRLVQLWRYMFEHHRNASFGRPTFSKDNLAWAVEQLK